MNSMLRKCVVLGMALAVASPVLAQIQTQAPPIYDPARQASRMPVLSTDGTIREEWFVTAGSNPESIDRVGGPQRLELMWRAAGEGPDKMMIEGSIRNLGRQSARIGAVQLLVTDDAGKLLRKVTVSSARGVIPRGEAKAFSVRFAMNEPPAGPVRVKLAQVLAY